MSLDWYLRAAARSDRGRSCAIFSAGISAAAPAMRRSWRRRCELPGQLRRKEWPRCLISAPVSRQRRARPRRARDRRRRRAADLCANGTGAYPAWSRRSMRLGLKPGDHLRHGAAEPLGSRDAALGLPVRRHRDHADELARQPPTNSISSVEDAEAQARSSIEDVSARGGRAVGNARRRCRASRSDERQPARPPSRRWLERGAPTRAARRTPRPGR